MQRDSDARFGSAIARARDPGSSLSRSREADIVLDHGIRPNRHAIGVCQIELAKHDLVAPDLAQEILEDLDRQLLARAAAVAKAERSKAGIVANRMAGAIDDREFNGGTYSERRLIRRNGRLTSQTIAIEGLSGTSTDVLVRIDSLGGATQTERLSPTKTTFVVQSAPGGREVAATYLRLGIEHIVFGFDYLLFVLALVILIGDWRRVALTVTAFTIAHSITLAAATLGFVDVPRPPVEAAIALSIVLVAVEIVNARRGRPSLATRWPWLLAFCFGLLHGLGFAPGYFAAPSRSALNQPWSSDRSVGST